MRHKWGQRKTQLKTAWEKAAPEAWAGMEAGEDPPRETTPLKGMAGGIWTTPHRPDHCLRSRAEEIPYINANTNQPCPSVLKMNWSPSITRQLRKTNKRRRIKKRISLGKEPILWVCYFKVLHHPKPLSRYGPYINICIQYIYLHTHPL